jgi:serine/threonine protein kinase
MQPIEGQLERGTVIGGYRIDELISRGGMGVVYRVTNVALNRIYALKVLAPALADDTQYRERFKREMRIAASLHHPHVVAIHYAGEDDGTLFFVMDFIFGTDLRQVLRTGGALDPERAVDLLGQMTSALDAAHTRGLVHRDVKPANILMTVVDGEERAYLTDFGVAKRSDAASELTAQGVAVGTVDYMSPEQINGLPTDARTDVYALGCVFFQMLTGRVPYERENSVAKLFAHVHDPPPPLDGGLAEVYPAFASVIDTAMAKDPDARYPSAGDFARDAGAALRGMRYSGPMTSVATGEATPAGRGEPPLVERAGPGDETAPAHGSQPPMPAVSQTPAAETPPTAPPPSQPPQPPQPPVTEPPATGPARGPGRRRWPLAAVGTVVVAGVIAAVVVIATGGSSNSPTKPAGEPFASSDRPVPTNRVTGSGTGRLVLSGDVVTITVDTQGLLNGSAHAMHIHAGAQGICPPASAARVHNGHLSINTGDGLRFYGEPQASLTETGDTSPKSIVDFPRYPSVGAIRYKRTFAIPTTLANEIRAGDAVLVIHGIDYNDNGIYDGVLGVSDLSKSLPAEATAPALCGPLFSTQTASTAPRGTTTYVVSLHPYTPPVTSTAFWLLCHLEGYATPAAAVGDPSVA